jgi:amino acid transporter
MEVTMRTEAQRAAVTREHLSWCYVFALFWLIFAIIIFGGAYLLAEAQQLSDSNRTLMFIMLGTIVVTSAIWQAVGFTLARLENLILTRIRS